MSKSQPHFSVLRALDSSCDRRVGSRKSYLVRITRRVSADEEGKDEEDQPSRVEEVGPVMVLDRYSLAKSSTNQGRAPSISLDQVFQEEWLRKELFETAGGEKIVRPPIKVWSPLGENGEKEEIFVLLPLTEEGDGPIPEEPPKGSEGTEEFEEALEKREDFLDQMESKIQTVAQMHSSRINHETGQCHGGQNRAVSFSSSTEPPTCLQQTTWSERELFLLLASAASHIKSLHERGFVHGHISASTIEVERSFRGGTETDEEGKNQGHSSASVVPDSSPPPKDPRQATSRKESQLTFRLRSLAHCVRRQQLEEDPYSALHLLTYTDRSQFPNQKPPHIAPELHRWIRFAHVWKDDLSQNSFLVRDWKAVDMYHLGLTVLQLALGIGSNDDDIDPDSQTGGSQTGGNTISNLPSSRSHLWENFLSLRISNSHGHLTSLLDSLSSRGYSSNLQAFLSQLLQSAPSKRPSPDVVASCMTFLQVEKSLRRSERHSQQRGERTSHQGPSKSREKQRVTPRRPIGKSDGVSETTTSRSAASPTARTEIQDDSREQKFALRSVSHFCVSQRREIRKVLDSAVNGAKEGERAQKGHSAAPAKLIGIHHEYYSEAIRREKAPPFPRRPVSASGVGAGRASRNAQKTAAASMEEMFV